jgi:hypothetical protein
MHQIITGSAARHNSGVRHNFRADCRSSSGTTTQTSCSKGRDLHQADPPQVPQHRASCSKVEIFTAEHPHAPQHRASRSKGEDLHNADPPQASKLTEDPVPKVEAFTTQILPQAPQHRASCSSVDPQASQHRLPV